MGVTCFCLILSLLTGLDSANAAAAKTNGPPHAAHQIQTPTSLQQETAAASQTQLDVPASRSQNAAAQIPALDSADLTAFIDGLVPIQLARGELAGAVVIVIQGDRILLKKGYGFSNFKRKTPIDPDQTLFRFGSISKLMTFVSAMQLVEQGRLDLDADVNKYLDFQIEPAFDQPVTVRTLMTHTAGFEHQQQYILQHVGDPQISLRDYLIRFQPKRIYPPGIMGSYSGYGVSLIGYIVQRISGERYQDYVQHRIFDPLGMTRSTFDQPLPPALRDFLSQGYFSTSQSPNEFEVFNPAPSGAMSGTLADLARFSQALMNGGEWHGTRILRPETVQEMWTRQFSVSPALPAMCLGFYEINLHGMRFVGHNGDSRVFHSQVEIQPERKLIIMSAYNSLGSDYSGQETARLEVVGGILDRYFPYRDHPTWQPVDAQAREIDGVFMQARRIESGRMKLDSLGDQIRTHVNNDGELLIADPINPRAVAHRLRYLGDDLWQVENGAGRIKGVRDRNGRLNSLASMFGAKMMVRVSWWEDARFVIPFTAISLIIAGLVVCGMLLQLVRRLFPSKHPKTTKARTPLTTAQRLAALVWIPAVPIFLICFVRIAHEPIPDFPRVPWYFAAQNVLVGIAILLSIPSIYAAFRVVSRSQVSIRCKLKHGAVGAGYAFLIWFSLHWHLVGPIQRY